MSEYGKGKGYGAGKAKGNYKGPSRPGSVSTTYPNRIGAGDSTGVQDGLSELASFDANEAGRDAYELNAIDPLTGNPSERKDQRKSKSVSKRGYNFDIEGAC